MFIAVLLQVSGVLLLILWFWVAGGWVFVVCVLVIVRCLNVVV